MTFTRTISTRLLVVLSVAAGLFLGLLAGREWALEAESAARQRSDELRREVSAFFHSQRDWAQRRADSLEWVRAHRPLNGMGFPREVRRQQALHHCVVTFAFIEGGTELELFTATAQGDWRTPLRSGFVYQKDGFPQGSIVDVVIPEIECGEIRTFSVGATPVDFPPNLPRRVPPAPAVPSEPAEPIS